MSSRFHTSRNRDDTCSSGYNQSCSLAFLPPGGRGGLPLVGCPICQQAHQWHLYAPMYPLGLLRFIASLARRASALFLYFILKLHSLSILFCLLAKNQLLHLIAFPTLRTQKKRGKLHPTFQTGVPKYIDKQTLLPGIVCHVLCSRRLTIPSRDAGLCSIHHHVIPIDTSRGVVFLSSSPSPRH